MLQVQRCNAPWAGGFRPAPVPGPDLPHISAHYARLAIRLLDRYDKLAHGGTASQCGDRVATFLERVARRNRRPDRALLVQFQQLTRAVLEPDGIALYPGSPEDADDPAGFQQREVQRQPWDAGGESDDEKAPIPGNAAQSRLGVFAANGIVDDIGAVAGQACLNKADRSRSEALSNGPRG